MDVVRDDAHDRKLGVIKVERSHQWTMWHCLVYFWVEQILLQFSALMRARKLSKRFPMFQYFYFLWRVFRYFKLLAYRWRPWWLFLIFGRLWLAYCETPGSLLVKWGWSLFLNRVHLFWYFRCFFLFLQCKRVPIFLHVLLHLLKLYLL